MIPGLCCWDPPHGLDSKFLCVQAGAVAMGSSSVSEQRGAWWGNVDLLIMGGDCFEDGCS
jgi:hypothetical protein